jgi:hypothetical protein
MKKTGRYRWTQHVARMGEKRNTYWILVGNPEGKKPLEKPRRKWENVVIDLKEIRWGGMEWINLGKVIKNLLVLDILGNP